MTLVIGPLAHTDKMGDLNVSQSHGKYVFDNYRIFEAPDLGIFLFPYFK